MVFASRSGLNRTSLKLMLVFCFTKLGFSMVSSRLYTQFLARNPNPRSKIFKSSRKTSKKQFHTYKRYMFKYFFVQTVVSLKRVSFSNKRKVLAQLRGHDLFSTSLSPIIYHLLYIAYWLPIACPCGPMPVTWGKAWAKACPWHGPRHGSCWKLLALKG